jgi:hypothetical protein
MGSREAPWCIHGHATDAVCVLCIDMAQSGAVIVRQPNATTVILNLVEEPDADLDGGTDAK